MQSSMGPCLDCTCTFLIPATSRVRKYYRGGVEQSGWMAPRRPVIMYRISAVQSLASTRSKHTRRHHHRPRQYLVCPVGSTGCLQSSIMMIMSWSIIMPPSRVQCRLSRGHYSRLVGATSQQGPAHCNCPPLLLLRRQRRGGKLKNDYRFRELSCGTKRNCSQSINCLWWMAWVLLVTYLLSRRLWVMLCSVHLQ